MKQPQFLTIHSIDSRVYPLIFRAVNMITREIVNDKIIVFDTPGHIKDKIRAHQYQELGYS